MSSDETKNIVEDALEYFDKIQLETLAVHIEIHQRLIKRITKRLRCDASDLPRLTFANALKLAYAGERQKDLIALLQKLNKARNVLAHEDNSSAFFAAFAEFQQAALLGEYNDNPASFEEKKQQAYKGLHFTKVWVSTG